MNDPSEHPDDATLHAHAARRLAAGAALRVSDHLQECAACRDRFRAAPRVPPNAPGELDPPQPASGPDFAELAAVASGDLGAEAEAELARRIAESPVLAAELADLRALAAGGVAPAVPIPFPRRPGGPKWLRFAAAAAVAVTALGWWLSSRRGEPALPADVAALVAQLERTPRLREIAPPGLRPPPLELAGSPNPGTLAALHPVGTSVRGASPTFAWHPLADAAGYRITIERLDDGEISESPRLAAKANSWTPPTPLAAGRLHQWEVEALAADGSILAKSPRPPEPEARFRILTDGEAREVGSFEQRWAGQPFVRGALLARRGLRAEALAAFAEAARGPDSPQARAAQAIVNGER